MAVPSSGRARPAINGAPAPSGARAGAGVRVRDVLDYCAALRTTRCTSVIPGADRHLSGDPAKQVISRGVPIAKALEPESLIAFELNGEAIPPLHGAPLAFGLRRLAGVGFRQVADRPAGA